MKQHVVDGAHILRRTPEMPALAPVVAFEHHLKQDLSGYPENIGHREAEPVHDDCEHGRRVRRAAQQPRYREGLATDRIKSIMASRTTRRSTRCCCGGSST